MRVFAVLQPDCLESGLVQLALNKLSDAGFSISSLKEVQLQASDLREIYHKYFSRNKPFAEKLLQLHCGHHSIIVEMEAPGTVDRREIYSFITTLKKGTKRDASSGLRKTLLAENKIRNRIHMPSSARENRILAGISKRQLDRRNIRLDIYKQSTWRP